MLTRTSRALRTVRTGYAYQPPAYYQTGPLAPKVPSTNAVRVPAPGLPYSPRTVAPQVVAELEAELKVHQRMAAAASMIGGAGTRDSADDVPANNRGGQTAGAAPRLGELLALTLTTDSSPDPNPNPNRRENGALVPR